MSEITTRQAWRLARISCALRAHTCAVLLVGAGGCLLPGCGEDNPSVPSVDTASGGAATNACQGQENGTACGSHRHCIYGSCRKNRCGDGVRAESEACDDGNLTNGDGCDDTCRGESDCGNGHVEAGETCDDGNTDDGDGCSMQCSVENAAA